MNIEELYTRLQDGQIAVNYKHHQINPLLEALEMSIRHFRELAGNEKDNVVQEVGKTFLSKQIEYCKPITGGVADNMSHYCFHCGKQLFMVMTDDTHLTFVETDDYYNIPPEMRDEGINPAHYTDCACKDLIRQRKLTADIDIPTGKLVFANYFNPDEISTNPERRYEKEYSLNATLGRYNLMQHLAQKNVGYGQMANMLAHIYVKNDGSEIILGPRHKYDDEGQESEVVYEGFTYAGEVNCDAWRWQCADRQLLDKYEDPFPKFCNEPVCVEIPVKSGKWHIEHFFEFYSDEDDRKGLPYSRLTHISRQTGKYSVRSLKKADPSYDNKHGVTQSDVDMANSYVALIESTRSDTIPKAGDRLRYTDKHGSYYSHAHIEYNRDGECNICEQPYVPFIWSDGQKEIRCSTSGGAWTDLKSEDLRYIGKELKTFCDWGHCRACANGAVHFTAEVSLWEYIHPEPLFEDYTTEKWLKLYVSKISEENRENHSDYLYVASAALPCRSGSTAFRTEGEYLQFLENFKARVFPGNWHNQSVVFCYREQQRRISQEEYDALDLPVISIFCNGRRPAKIGYDDENKIATTHFVM